MAADFPNMWNVGMYVYFHAEENQPNKKIEDKIEKLLGNIIEKIVNKMFK